MKAFVSFLVGLILGIAGTWWWVRSNTAYTSRGDRDVIVDRPAVETPADRRSDTAERVEDNLRRTGDVIREKANEAGNAIADATADARISAAIKGKLIAETSLSAFRIDVDTADGVVTLSGTVPSARDAAAAIEIARNTEGVREVVSSLRVK